MTENPENNTENERQELTRGKEGPNRRKKSSVCEKESVREQDKSINNSQVYSVYEKIKITTFLLDYYIFVRRTERP